MSTIIYGRDFKCANLKHNLGIDILSTPVNITLECLPEDYDDRQATSYYLMQCWWSLSPYSMIRPHWVNDVKSHVNNNLLTQSLKTESCYDDNIVITGDTKCCRFHKWMQSWHHDNAWFSAFRVTWMANTYQWHLTTQVKLHSATNLRV